MHRATREIGRISWSNFVPRNPQATSFHPRAILLRRTKNQRDIDLQFFFFSVCRVKRNNSAIDRFSIKPPLRVQKNCSKFPFVIFEVKWFSRWRRKGEPNQVYLLCSIFRRSLRLYTQKSHERNQALCENRHFYKIGHLGNPPYVGTLPLGYSGSSF